MSTQTAVQISHRTIGEGLGVHRTTVGRAVRKLTKVGVIEDAGKVVVNHEAGTWVKRYRIVDRSPDLPEVHPARMSGQLVQILPLPKCIWRDPKCISRDPKCTQDAHIQFLSIQSLRYQSLFQMLNLKLRKTQTPTAKPKAHRRGS
jgi:DNA-binding Lrp family transcriptional regulator